MFQFGIGDLYAVQTCGNAATPNYPQFFGTVQEANVEISQKLVELMGQNKFPDDVAPSDMKVTGKAGFARLEVDMYNNLFFADQVTAGSQVVQNRFPFTIPGVSPFTDTVVPPASGLWVKDLGVMYANRVPLIRTLTAPAAAGSYAVSNGVYSFAAADAGQTVLISFLYSTTAGVTLTVKNHLQGYGPVFEMYLMMPYQGNNGLHLYACRSSKMSAPMKRDGYTISDFEFTGYASATGNVIDFFEDEVPGVC